jgi:hypothetical protein
MSYYIMGLDHKKIQDKEILTALGVEFLSSYLIKTTKFKELEKYVVSAQDVKFYFEVNGDCAYINDAWCNNSYPLVNLFYSVCKCYRILISTLYINIKDMSIGIRIGNKLKEIGICNIIITCKIEDSSRFIKCLYTKSTFEPFPSVIINNAEIIKGTYIKTKYIDLEFLNTILLFNTSIKFIDIGKLVDYNGSYNNKPSNIINVNNIKLEELIIRNNEANLCYPLYKDFLMGLIKSSHKTIKTIQLQVDIKNPNNLYNDIANEIYNTELQFSSLLRLIIYCNNYSNNTHFTLYFPHIMNCHIYHITDSDFNKRDHYWFRPHPKLIHKSGTLIESVHFSAFLHIAGNRAQVTAAITGILCLQKILPKYICKIIGSMIVLSGPKEELNSDEVFFAHDYISCVCANDIKKYRQLDELNILINQNNLQIKTHNRNNTMLKNKIKRRKMMIDELPDLEKKLSEDIIKFENAIKLKDMCQQQKSYILN